MIKDYRVVRALAERVAKAVDFAQADLGKEGLRDPAEFVARMLQAVSEDVAGREIQSIQWSVTTSTNVGPDAEKGNYVSDLLSVFNVNVSEARVSTGFLAQVHSCHASDSNTAELIRERCRRMLQVSSAAYLFLLSPKAVRIVPALSAVQTHVPLSQLYARSPQRFFEEHFECFLGDPRLSAANEEELKAIRSHCKVRAAVLILGEDRQPELF